MYTFIYYDCAVHIHSNSNLDMCIKLVFHDIFYLLNFKKYFLLILGTGCAPFRSFIDGNIKSSFAAAGQCKFCILLNFLLHFNYFVSVLGCLNTYSLI